MLFLFRARHAAAVVSPTKVISALAALISAAVLLYAHVAYAQTAAPSPNSDPTYQALRNLTLSGEAVSVSNFELTRDAGKFRLRSGTVCFTPPVEGKVTGAVFTGDGSFFLDPPSDAERKSLKLLTKEDEFNEKFEHLVLRFTDSTYEDIKKAGTPTTSGCDTGLLKDSQNTTRHKLKKNLELRLLEEVLSPEPRDFFIAFIHGKRYNDKEIFEIDPDWGSNQVSFRTYDEMKWGEWASFSLSHEGRKHSADKPYKIEHQQLDTTFEKSGSLSGKATTTLVTHRDGLRVIPFSLFRPLRVQSVTADGQALSFIQEDKNDDGDFAVILPRAVAARDICNITTTYAGKEAVSNEGGGNYFPVARDDWYPNNPGARLGEYATYDMTFRIPKSLKMAATGTLVSESDEGGQNVSVWKSEAPQTVAGFSFGKFKEEQAKLTDPEYFIQSFANPDPPDWVDLLKLGGMPGMETTSLNKKALAEAELAVPLYTRFFGPPLFKHLQLTQQTSCAFGQSWPELVWIPMCYYFDETVRHSFRLDWGDRGYWKVVTPHEIAHQWWGNTVGFSAGRDQWMSEGFADMSASLYLTMIEKDPKKFIKFWNDERELLLERDAQGFRAIDAGPLTMGYRASNSRTGFDTTRRLIYPKGAYILHMIRFMMWSNQTAEERFKETMQDFVKTYSGRSATTEDFKAMIEKHMTREMDMEGDHKMDWFFNEYVYGTQLPSYQFNATFDTGADGNVVMSFKVTQSGVDDKFRMLVPIYVEMADGKTVFLGRARMAGNTSVEQKVTLKGWKTPPRRALINYYDDVLASPN